jgi:DNA-binding SARP family transcriptional activator
MLEQAMTLVESPLLPEEIDCEWLDELRIIHNHKVRKGLIAAAGKVARIQPDSAQRWARLALEGDTLDESAWHALLESMEAGGQHADGLREYDNCRRLLLAELGCTPGPSLQELYVRLLRGANEDDEQLSRLFDAVVRLHVASHVGAPSPVRDLRSKRLDASDQAASVKQAYRALDLLLRSVGGDHKRPHMALGA